jgi:hypothetical protein
MNDFLISCVALTKMEDVGIEEDILLPLLHHAALPDDGSDLTTVSTESLKHTVSQMRRLLATLATDVMNLPIHTSHNDDVDVNAHEKPHLIQSA